MLTLEPETLAAPQAESGWITELMQYLRRAAASGEVVTVSSKPKMMTPSEVAQGLMMSRSTVSRKIAAGEIKSVKVGNRHRIPYQEYRRVWEQTMRIVAKQSAADIEAELFGDE